MDRLIDDFGRNLNYVRISVTDRCNYRCKYCMPPEGVEFLDHSEIMRYEEITFLCGVLWELGVRKVRFTGGEPLVRRG
ncbi:MAG: radical SAM protein, partial [Synergistaceae bacterium]